MVTFQLNQNPSNPSNKPESAWTTVAGVHVGQTRADHRVAWHLVALASKSLQGRVVTVRELKRKKVFLGRCDVARGQAGLIFVNLYIDKCQVLVSRQFVDGLCCLFSTGCLLCVIFSDIDEIDLFRYLKIFGLDFKLVFVGVIFLHRFIFKVGWQM